MLTEYIAQIRDLDARGKGYEEYRRAFTPSGAYLGFVRKLGRITHNHWPKNPVKAADRHCSVRVEADFPAGTIILATYLRVGGACHRDPDVGVVLAEPLDGEIIDWNNSHTYVASERRGKKWVTVIEREGGRLELQN